MLFSQCKTVIDSIGRDGLEDLLITYSKDIVISALKCGIDPSNIEESYAGKWNSDEEFTQQLLEDTGVFLPSYIHIDWTATAHDVMMDYCEANGYYFRNV